MATPLYCTHAVHAREETVRRVVIQQSKCDYKRKVNQSALQSDVGAEGSREKCKVQEVYEV